MKVFVVVETTIGIGLGYDGSSLLGIYKNQADAEQVANQLDAVMNPDHDDDDPHCPPVYFQHKVVERDVVG